MKITLAKSAGFCFGVKRAIDIASKAAEEGKRVHMLGDIVHNEDVVQRLEQSGIKKIDRLSSGEGKSLLVRAHGAAASTINDARTGGYDIIDATCPMVHKIHTIAQQDEQNGYTIIIIGEKDHDEVAGIVGQIETRPIVIEHLNEIPSIDLGGASKASVVVQSTQVIEHVEAIVAALKQKFFELKFSNTICKETRIRQDEIKTLPLQNDAMLIIGSKTSGNTKRLYELSKELNQKTYWIQHAEDIDTSWFKGLRTVGITSGASTPDETIRRAVEYVRTL